MSDKDKNKKAKWPISERANDLENSASWQRTQGKSLDTRGQTDRTPVSDKINKLRKRGKK